MKSPTSHLTGEDDSSSTPPPIPPKSPAKWATSTMEAISSELRAQRGIALPLAAMNLTWFAKTATTTAFLGRLGDLELAGGALGFTFANVTGFSVLTGLCCAMEPICGQAFGAKNYKLMHKTLFMATILLLLVSLPISFLWLNVDKILIHFGQQRDIAHLAKIYVRYLIPDLVVTSFLCPLKSYLNSQGVTLPTLFSSAVALALHIPVNILLSRSKGLVGVSMAIWLTDLSVMLMLLAYVFFTETKKKVSSSSSSSSSNDSTTSRLWEQKASDWLRLLRLSAPCCLTTCLEWWCYEILVLLTGRLPDAKRMVAVIAVVLNFDYLLYSGMLSLATCASIRVSNELGAGNAGLARRSAFVSVGASAIAGVLGGSAMVGARGNWGFLFSHDRGIVDGVRKMMLVMAMVEVVNFPLAVCGGIVRGTAKPWLGMYASIGGFYLVALPVAVALGFKVGLGLGGLLLGFLVGAVTSVVVLMVLVGRIDWEVEAEKARRLAGVEGKGGEECGGAEVEGGGRV